MYAILFEHVFMQVTTPNSQGINNNMSTGESTLKNFGRTTNYELYEEALLRILFNKSFKIHTLHVVDEFTFEFLSFKVEPTFNLSAILNTCLQSLGHTRRSRKSISKRSQ